MTTRTAVLDLIQSRRSLRRYLADPIPPEMINELLSAATWAPSAHNRQPWRFAVLDNASSRIALATAMGNRLRRDLEADSVAAEIIEKDVARSYERLSSAPVVIVLCLSMADMDVYPDEKRSQAEYLMAVQSVAMAGQNLLLGAHSAGLGACWLCAPLFCPDVVRHSLELPPDWQPQGLITLGYPAQTREKARRPLAQNVLWR